MTRSRARTFISAVVFAVLAGSATRADAQYTYTKIMVPNSTWTEASGINDLGQVVGTYTDASGVAHGFLYANGTYSDLDFPGMAHNYAFGISDTGQVVGSFSPVMPRGPYSASLLENGVWSGFDFPGHETDARAINASGHIVGIYNAGLGTPDHGFLKVGDTYTSIDFPGAPITYVLGLNDAGYVTGTYRDPFGFVNGFVYFNGNYSAISYSTASETIVAGINNSNTMVGWKIEAGKTSGYVLSAGRFRPVIVPFANTSATKARGINDAGSIVGSYNSPDCPVGCSFLATPAPSLVPICDQAISMSYTGGILTNNFSVRSNQPTTWTTWLVVQGIPFRLWSSPIPAINPASSMSVPLRLAPSGNVVLASFMSTAAHGTVCVDFATLNTSPAIQP